MIFRGLLLFHMHAWAAGAPPPAAAAELGMHAPSGTAAEFPNGLEPELEPVDAATTDDGGQRVADEGSCAPARGAEGMGAFTGLRSRLSAAACISGAVERPLADADVAPSDSAQCRSGEQPEAADAWPVAE
jgi:hypothetical protein